MDQRNRSSLSSVRFSPCSVLRARSSPGRFGDHRRGYRTPIDSHLGTVPRCRMSSPTSGPRLARGPLYSPARRPSLQPRSIGEENPPPRSRRCVGMHPRALLRAPPLVYSASGTPTGAWAKSRPVIDAKPPSSLCGSRGGVSAPHREDSSPWFSTAQSNDPGPRRKGEWPPVARGPKRLAPNRWRTKSERFADVG